VATSGSTGTLACSGFGFAATRPPAAFDIFYWRQVTNNSVLYVLFDSLPSGSNHVDAWDLFLHSNCLSPIISSQPFSQESRPEQAEKDV
jgi:hypothetical protein